MGYSLCHNMVHPLMNKPLACRRVSPDTIQFYDGFGTTTYSQAEWDQITNLIELINAGEAAAQNIEYTQQKAAITAARRPAKKDLTSIFTELGLKVSERPMIERRI